MMIKEISLEALLALSVIKQSSDLHLSPGMPPIVRIDGEMIPLEDYPSLDAEVIKNLLYYAMEEDQRQQLKSGCELDFSFIVPQISRFRVNVFNQMHGIAAVFRVIPENVPTLDQLGLPAIFKRLLDLPNGLILVTGPTGSGKSTTLAAMIDCINLNHASHIISIEDPIEFIHKSKKSLINQRQVHRDTKSFEAALRAALREDPDVILLGEMRDLETIRLALTAAETGHLVLATLHTSSAPRAISRMIDVFPTGEKNRVRNLLAESLQAVIYQTLIRKIPKGRVAAFEIMLGTPAMRNLIREDKISQMYTAMQTSKEAGMCTLDQYLQTLATKQMISFETMRTVNKEKGILLV